MNDNLRPNISVVIPLSNDSRIAGCLNSLLTQNYNLNKVEIIVIDNGCNYYVQSILNQYHHHIVLLKENKKGPYAARNKGLERAKAPIVAFTDADCIQDSNWLLEIEKSFKQSDISAVQGISYGIDKNYFASLITIMNITNILNTKKDDGKLTTINTRNCALNKNKLNGLKFNENMVYWGDFILGQDLYNAGGIIVLNENLINYHRNIHRIKDYLVKSYHIGNSIRCCLEKNPNIMKNNLEFIQPIIQSKYGLCKKIRALFQIIQMWCELVLYIYRMNDEKSIDLIFRMNSIVFFMGLNDQRIRNYCYLPHYQQTELPSVYKLSNRIKIR